MMWLPIETLPRDFSLEVDMWADGKRYTDCSLCLPDDHESKTDYHWCYSEYERGWGCCYYRVPNPTYWMPVPSAPKIEALNLEPEPREQSERRDGEGEGARACSTE